LKGFKEGEGNRVLGEDRGNDGFWRERVFCTQHLITLVMV